MKKASIVILFLFIIQTSYALSGSEWMYAGWSPSANGMGYAAAASQSYAGDVFFNPANPAFVRRFTFFGQWGITQTNYVGDFGASFPFPRGVMTLAIRTLNVAPPDSVQSVLAFSGAFSKVINDRLSFGVSAQFLNQADSTGGDMGLTLDAGMIVKLPGRPASAGAFGFRDNRIGIVLTGLGKPALLDSATPVPGMGLRIGFATKLLSGDVVEWNWEWDAGLYALPFTYYTSLGTKLSLARRLNLSAGLIYGNNGLGSGSNGLLFYTAGVSFSFQYEDTPFELFYSYNPYRYGTDSACHFIGAEVAFGTLDNTPPEIAFALAGQSTNIAVFSPNYDGANDTVLFGLSVRDVSLITNWVVTIVRRDGSVVKTYRGSEERDVRLTLRSFFQKLAEKKQGLPVPENLTWNGITDSGHIAGDGEYFVFMQASDEFGNGVYSATNRIVVDMTPPSIQLGIDNLVFSPNGDGRKDTVTIFHEFTRGDSYRSEIRDKDGDVVRDWNWRTNLPAKLVWDGTDNRGEPAPEGTYDYILYGSDRAGNKSILSIPNIHLSRRSQSVFLTIDKDAFSPNSDGDADSISVTPSLSDTNGIASWKLEILDASGTAVYRMNGTTVAPGTTVWQGLDSAGKRVPDGVYMIRMSVEYDNGNSPVSPDYTVRVDTAPPQLEIGFTPDLFSPDNDGDNDELKLFWTLNDPDGIASWKMEIRDPYGHSFKVFEGTGAPASNIVWDGRSDNGEPVDSATDYPVYLSFEDTLGNRITSLNAVTIPVDVLVERIDRGLKIRINSIEFEFGEAILKGMSYPILNRVAQILKKYSTYKVEIQGHTDNVGSLEANLSLSEERAKAVLEYLVRQGIARNRLSATGLAYQYPVDTNDTEEGRRRNRRVEFILLRE